MTGPWAAHPKIRRSHLDRAAIVYVRQSSLAQVRENTESTARQYALADEAVRLGWAHRDVVVIDADLGLSGRSAEHRSGFREVVSRVCLGEVGAIFGLEISRLARSSADLSRLLELARLTDTLLVDGDGIYDLTDFNDRLLLGLKGTMSEAELHLLAGRLQGAKRAAAERGDLRVPLPVGYVHDPDGDVIIDPDQEVQAAVADVFAAFRATGSAYGVVSAFKGRRFPLRAYGGAWAGQLRWGRLNHSRVLGVLTNPTYAGAYVFGRHTGRRTVQPDGSVRTSTSIRPRAEWPVCLRDHHPGYLGWEDYLANEAKLAANRTNAGARPVREGLALCQGIIGCGGCGRPMSTRYHHAAAPAYECSASRADQMTTPTCRSVSATAVDAAVTERLLAALNPEEVALALAAADEVAGRRARTTRAAELAVERARYDADRAERAFHAAEPENRLVTRTLETRWEAKLAALTDAETAYAVAQDTAPALPARADLEALVTDLPGLWQASSTTDRDRKRLLRTLIADVTVLPEPDRGKCRVGIRWHSGAADEIVIARPAAAAGRRTPPGAVDLITRLGPTTSNDDLVAELAAAGLTTGVGRPFDVKAVQWTRHAYHVPSPRLDQDGEVTVAEVARRVGVTANAVYYWIANHQLVARRDGAGRWRVPFPPEAEAACLQRVAQSCHLTPTTSHPTAGGAV
jgi:DNA invertase Pin-like site-specific DNA recombinase